MLKCRLLIPQFLVLTVISLLSFYLTSKLIKSLFFFGLFYLIDVFRIWWNIRGSLLQVMAWRRQIDKIRILKWYPPYYLPSRLNQEPPYILCLKSFNYIYVELKGIRLKSYIFLIITPHIDEVKRKTNSSEFLLCIRLEYSPSYA